MVEKTTRNVRGVRVESSDPDAAERIGRAVFQGWVPVPTFTQQGSHGRLAEDIGGYDNMQRHLEPIDRVSEIARKS